MGIWDYIIDVGIPSVLCYQLSKQEKLPYDYYGSPWESEADALGDVNRTKDNTPWPDYADTSIKGLFGLFVD